jgi:hypothetical protein
MCMHACMIDCTSRFSGVFIYPEESEFHLQIQCLDAQCGLEGCLIGHHTCAPSPQQCILMVWNLGSHSADAQTVVQLCTMHLQEVYSTLLGAQKFRKDDLSCLHTVHLWTCHFYVIFRAFVVSCAPTLVERMHGLSSVKRVQHLLYGGVRSSQPASALEYHIGVAYWMDSKPIQRMDSSHAQ